MKDMLKLGAIILIPVVIAGAILTYKITTWNECRNFGHTVFYCWRTLH
jgi:hypothetical protein